MSRTRTLPLAAAALLVFTAGAGPARSAVALRWDHDWLQVASGNSAVLAVLLDDPLPLRTVELWVRYDPDLVAGVDASAGSLFQGVPCYIWQDYEETEPGLWHGFAVIIGGDCQVTGPGELFVWEFTARQNTGVAEVESVEAVLRDPDAAVIADVTLGRTFVSVGAEPAPAPPPAPGPRLRLFPNPFNPAASIRIEGRECERAVLDVFDARGRRLARLFEGPLPAGGLTLRWDGRDGRGAALPSGRYLFRCRCPQASATVAGILLR